MKKLLLAFIIILLSNSAYSESKKKEYNCLEERNKIINRLTENVTCQQDSDCRYFDFGYPWQLSACMKPLVSTSEEGKNITNLRLIDIYNKSCILNNEKTKAEYQKFQTELENIKCKLVRTYCLSGICRTAGYALYDQQNATIRDKSQIKDVDVKEIMGIR